MAIYLMFCLLAIATLAVPGLVHATMLDDVTNRAEETLQGMFQYYWTHDPNAKAVGFFFACGQVGGMGNGGNPWAECICYNQAACVNCYRWWDAVTLEAIANYGIYTKTKQYAKIPDTFFAHSPYNGNWNAKVYCTFVDDFSWYGIAYLRVYDWLQDKKWLDRSIAIYNWTWTNGWDEGCGGFWWSTCGNMHFKDSITIVEILHFGSKLAFMFPKEALYLERAQKIWDWIFSFNDGYGLMSDKYLMSTGAVPEQCCNNTVTDPLTRCVNSNVSGTSYNQGLLMSAAAYLYKATKNETYLKVGLRALEAILTNYTTKDGVLLDEPRSYQTYLDKCVAWEDPGGDWYSFQGIFMNHLSYFTTLLNDGVSLSNETLERIMKFVELTSDSAWTKSAVRPPFKQGADVCESGPLNPNVTYPKFHWWWGQNSTNQIIPPDPHQFYHKVQLRCESINGNDTQIWEGMAYQEDTCKLKCAINPNCSKYLYQIDQKTVQGYNCWIWSYNRSNHNCAIYHRKFNVGIKRPLSTGTCVDRCGSKDPVKMQQGECYCDSDCLTHLDCCLDYANQCTTANTVPSCKGKCKKTQAQALQGGGYCWCNAGCNPWYTDNNSDGSCCPDYREQCSKQKIIPPCLDARSQGSALNLFVSHLNLVQQLRP